MRRPVSTPGREEAAEAAVAAGIVRSSVLPDAPDDAEPGAPEDAQRVGVVFAARDRVSVELLCPGVVPAAGVGADADGAAQPRVAGPAEAGDLALAGLHGNRSLAGDRLERDAGGVALAPVADLGQQLGGADDRFRVTEERAEDRAVGVLVERASDLAGQQPDLLDEGLERGGEAEHDRAPRLGLELAHSAGGRQAQPGEQLGGALAAAVAVAGEGAGEALLAKAARLLRAGVALEEGEADERVDVGEDAGSAGPERFQLRPQLVGERDPLLDQVLARPGQRSQRPGLVRVGFERAEGTRKTKGEVAL